jgi:hypothetical protein
MYAPAALVFPVEKRRIALGEISTILYFAAIAFAMTVLLFMNVIGQSNAARMKYALFGLALLASVADLLFDPGSFARLVRVLRSYWSFVAVALIVIGGSLYTRFTYGLHDTFLSHGLGLSGFFIAYQLLSPERLATFGRLLVKTFLFFSILAFACAPFYFAQRTPTLHEAGYLFVPWILFFAWQQRRGVLGRGLIVLLLLVIGPLCLKNTITVTAALCLGLFYLFDHARNYSLTRTVFFARTYVMVFVIALAVAAFYLLAPPLDGFSSGNADFRMYCYRAKFAQFLESPWFGNWYVGPPYIPFTLFIMTIGPENSIAVTHNDFLDMLASGGALVMGLVLWGLVKVAKALPGKITSVKDNREEFGMMAALTAVVLGGLVAMAFNPVMGNLFNGFMFWSMLGMTAACCEGQVFAGRAMSEMRR